ncbi:E3 ubiquitin-protein ligase NEURL1B isoform X1 [Epinephelus fuscoguttatus]|uniref:E3 ubiquitin-protein ligase NEURL1B isoform X1 n=1 Tax=Epinephelus fuscoguttatus TaxID=293821 RepID=UPI0020D1BB7A|nr:E3 ubiquitin-protein ligase NEURL1B isoform X1 [Epinephelus fuscoguttatus]
MGNKMGNNQSSNTCIPFGVCSLPQSNREKKLHHSTEDASLQPRPVASRQYYTLPNNGAGVERRTSAAPVSISVESPRFHPHAKGKNIRLDGQLRRATRKNSFCNGITFSHRPVHLYEKVRLRLSGVHTGWSGALRFGFTSLDPSELVATDIPKYACPDLVTRPGYWAKALPERLALKDNVLSFWADRHGRVFYSINEGEPILFHCGLSIGCPLWAIIDIYGITQEVTLLESTFAESVGSSCLSAARLSAYLPQSSHDSANYNNNQLENNQAAAAKMANLQLNNYTQLIPCCSSTSSSSTPSSSASTGFSVPRVVRGLPSPLDNDLHFHLVRGSDVILSADRSAACIHFLDSSRTLVFSDRPLHVGETLYVEVGHLGLPYFGALLFGLTSCDPASLHAGDLPADPEVLLDRKEYWVVHRGFPMPCSGDVLSFSLLPSGEVHHGVNGVGRGRLLCVDSSQVLWAFFTLHGAVNRLRILGTLQSSPPSTSPSTSQSSSPDDSDSDLAFSVNRSSSASESSLVTAPSSPLSPPVSPTLTAPELPSAGKNGECTICFDQDVDTVIYTCGHMCLCNDCGLKLKRQINACCPICRRPIKDVIKTYRP